MCGVSGSGKTFLARRLVGKGFLRLSSDEIIWNLYGLPTK
ncbi:AAA family ATPase [Paramuribaculum intestinale]